MDTYIRTRVIPYLLLIPLWSVTALIAFWYVQMASDPVSNKHREVLTDQIRPGDAIQISYTSAKLRRCWYSTTRYLNGEGGNQIILHHESYYSPRSPETKYHVSISTPTNLKPGVYKLVARVNYSCNPLENIVPHHTTYTFSEPIEVLPR